MHKSLHAVKQELQEAIAAEHDYTDKSKQELGDDLNKRANGIIEQLNATTEKINDDLGKRVADLTDQLNNTSEKINKDLEAQGQSLS